MLKIQDTTHNSRLVQQQAQRRVSTTQRNLSWAPRTAAPSQRQTVRSEAQLEGRNLNRTQPTNRGVTPNRTNNGNNPQVSGRGDRGNRQVNRGGNRNFNPNSFAVARDVQLALRDQGYYPGAVDGLIGPQTRAALGAFQRDHGLVVTEAVDEPTLVTLGLA